MSEFYHFSKSFAEEPELTGDQDVNRPLRDRIARDKLKLVLPAWLAPSPIAEARWRCENCRKWRQNESGERWITNMPVQALIGGMGRIMPDRPIVDKTGVTGFYDVDVRWEQPQADGLAPRVDTAAMNIALEEQAGLKLESQTGPVDFLVIDRVEKPSEN